MRFYGISFTYEILKGRSDINPQTKLLMWNLVYKKIKHEKRLKYHADEHYYLQSAGVLQKVFNVNVRKLLFCDCACFSLRFTQVCQ